jgi:hypothetical protein
VLNPIRDTAPEVLYGDATAKMAAYETLSHTYVAEGNAYAAIHAAWAADIHAVQVVMWEHVMIALPRPDETFAAITDAIGQAMSHFAASPLVPADARDAVLAARTGLLAAFGDSVGHAITEKFISLDHLAGLPNPTAEDGQHHALYHAGDDTAENLAAKRRLAASDGIAEAVACQQAGRLDDALAWAWYADWAALHGYLVETAVGVGDATLITVHMRWDMVCDEVARIPGLPADLATAVGLVRERMVAALGPIEGARLRTRFAPLT